MIHRFAGEREEIEDVELGIGQVVSLEEQFAATGHGVLNEEQSDQEIVGGRVRFHPCSLTPNRLTSN